MSVALFLIELPLILMVLYLDLLTIAAVLWNRRPAECEPFHTFALLVPAHNEEDLLPRMLASAGNIGYPPDLFDVHVVADNCSDGTVRIVHEAGATAHERHDLAAQGKGHALQWLLERIRDASSPYDAFVILDADTVVSPNLLSVMNNHLSRGDQAIQSRFLVGNPSDSWVSSISYIALALFNNLRPRGRDMLGFSTGLHGSGMCFTPAIIDRVGWGASLAEDAVFHIQLVRSGFRVRFADQALVLAEQPTSLRQAKSQSLRWERGRFQTMREYGPSMLWQGIRHRELPVLDLVAEVFVPQFSILTGAIGAVVFVSALVGASVPLVIGLSLALGEALYVLTGLYLVSAPRKVYVSLLAAPVYAVWKVWTIALAAFGINNRRWVRTARAGEGV